MRNDAAWGEAKLCELSKDTLSSYAHPAVSPKGDYLYFVSDMPGGYGGLDLWRVSLNGVSFGPVGTLVPTLIPMAMKCFRHFGLTESCISLQTAGLVWADLIYTKLWQTLSPAVGK